MISFNSRPKAGSLVGSWWAGAIVDVKAFPKRADACSLGSNVGTDDPGQDIPMANGAMAQISGLPSVIHDLSRFPGLPSTIRSAP